MKIRTSARVSSKGNACRCLPQQGTVSAKTLRTMDKAVDNFRSGTVSDPGDSRKRMDSVRRHHLWQQGLKKDEFFDRVIR